jgi:ankyrin repeat protein
MVRLLLSCGIDVNESTSTGIKGGPPLHIAALFNHAHVISLLLDAGADVQVKNAAGFTALEIARHNKSRNALFVLQTAMES